VTLPENKTLATLYELPTDAEIPRKPAAANIRTADWDGDIFIERN
jgi:hypothetical protein